MNLNIALRAAIGVCGLFQAGQQSLDNNIVNQRDKVIDQVKVTSDAGKWREEVIDPASQNDLLSMLLRRERNEYWHTHLPATDGTGQLGSLPPGAPEFGPISSRLVVVATFISHKVFEPAKGDGAYTEISMSVNKLLTNQSVADVKKGDVIDVGEPGGSIKSVDGQEHHYNLHYYPYTMQPGHIYLLKLFYIKAGEFYRFDQGWDLTSGIAIPIGVAEVQHFYVGDSQIGGLTSAKAEAKAEEIIKSRNAAR